MALTYDTLNTLTERFWLQKNLVDGTFRSTPVFLKMKETAKSAGGTAIDFPIQYALLGGGSRAIGGAITLTTPEIVTKGTMGWRRYTVPIQLDRDYLDINKNDPRKIAEMLQVYVSSGMDTMRVKWLSPDLWKAQTGNNLNSIVDAVDDSATYAGIAKADIPSWVSVVAEADYATTPDTCISPSLDNARVMIGRIQAVCGEKPDMIVTSPQVWDRWHEQVTANDMLAGSRVKQVVDWGFDVVNVAGVPAVQDLDMAAQTCADFDGTGGDRTNTAGHCAYFLNFKYLKMYYMKNRWMSWDETGWFPVASNTMMIRQLMHFTGNVICTNRRAQGVMYGIDPTQDASAFTRIDPSLTPFAAV